MALRDQPYLPLYVKDFLTDEKLIECSASATGVYIRLMCVMHKSERYGTILLKQKDKQNDSKIRNFAFKLVKLIGFPEQVIFDGLTELIAEGVIKINGDYLEQKRMIADCLLSEIRAAAGRQRGQKNNETEDFATAKVSANAIAKEAANAEYENEYVNGNDIKEKAEIFVAEFVPALAMDEKFMAAWKTLCKQKKWVKKSQDAINASIQKLNQFDAEFATDLVTAAIAGNYQGVVFADTKDKYRKLRKSNGNNFNRNGEEILAGRITKQGAENLLAAAIIRDSRNKNTDGNNGTGASADAGNRQDEGNT